MADNAALGILGIQAARAVNRDALAAQYERILEAYGAALMRLTAGYEGLQHAREDLLQEILLALWQALPHFRGDCSEKTFVFRVAHNRCLTHVWRRGKQPVAEADFDQRPGRERSPEVQAIEKSRRETLVNAVRALPVNYRQVIALALEDLSPAEIAAVLGVSENNVGVRLSRARKALRTILEGHA